MVYSVKVDGDLCECQLTADGVSFTSKTTSVQIKTEDIIGSEVVPLYRIFSGSGLDLWFIKQDCIKLTKSKVQISGDQNVWEKLNNDIKDITDKLTRRPKSLLVLINPIGGNKTGEKDYQNILAPIFKLANIKCEVMVSQRKRNMVDIVSSYDFSNTDGIVILGGDGSYSEVVNVLLREAQNKAGIDCNDPIAKLKAIKIPIGMIPSGTGNGVVGASTGCREVLNSTLHVIKGNVSSINMIGVYADNKLMDFAGVTVSNGCLTDMLHYADTKFRWLGRIRYYGCLLWQRLFQPFRTFNAEVTCYGKVSETNESKTQKEGEKEVLLEGRKVQGIKSYTEDSVVFDGVFKCIMSFDGNALNDGKKGHDWVHTFKTPGHVFSSVFFKESFTVPNSIKFVRDFMVQTEDSGEDDFLFTINARAIKFRIKDDDTHQEEEFETLKHLIQIDGEMYRAENLEIQIMLHQRVVPIFTSYL